MFLTGAATSVLAGGDTGKTDGALRSGMEDHKIPAVVAMVADERKALYSGAFGAAQRESIFSIASMTKAITTVAALQLVEQGKVNLDEPASRHLPELAHLEVLEGFDAAGKPSLRPVRTPVTLRHLLTHTSGSCYDIWDGEMFRWASSKGAAKYSKPGPLMFEPGKRWQYGEGLDWTGRLVESVSGATLENYFQEKIFRPLGMVDTSFILPAAKFDRWVTRYRRDASGVLKADERKMPAPPKAYSGGGGLYSTAADYLRFLQMILNQGVGMNGVRMLQEKTVRGMMINQIGELTAGKMKSFRPEFSADVDIQPGQTEKWGLGFLINTAPYPGGRSAGSLAWAGLYNTFYWIDPKRQRCAVILMQFLPFVDKEAVALLNEFEISVYREV
jgi:methyl acetate hydrolase